MISVLIAVCLCGCRFFPESMFQLAPESRLPRWFTVPKGLSRGDVTVTMYCYVGPLGRSSTFWLLDRNGNTLSKVNTVTEGLQPHEFEDAKAGYRAYEIETGNGFTEVTEFRQMEPVFYINDDPQVRKKLGLASPKKAP